MLNIKVLEKKKTEIDRFRPFSFELQRSLDEWDCVELTYTSNAIEGNSLTRFETAQLIEKDLTGASKPLVDYLEAKNHAEAFEFLFHHENLSNFDITERQILKIHQIILKGINEQIAGKYRNVPVRIRGSGTVFPNHVKVPSLMKEFIEWINGSHNLHPIDLAAEAHYKLVSIHPFVDGNGRTARLLMNFILRKFNYPPAIISLESKERYLSSLERAQINGDMSSFFVNIYESLNSSLENYLSVLKTQ